VVVIPVTSDIDTHIARRASREMARKAGFDTRAYSLIEIAVSELATNVVKYARQGTIRLKPLANGMEIVCEDQGPGIADLEAILAGKGKSATGLGIGLLGVSNFMDELEICSEQGCGTTITARKWKIKPAHLSETPLDIPRDGLLEYGVLSIPSRQGDLNGDALVIQETKGKVLLAVIDGLGHGQEAHHASQKAATYIRSNPGHDLKTLLEDCHAELRHTRGAVIGLVRVDLSRCRLTYAGIGNITGRIVGRQTIRPLSKAGIVGHKIKAVSQDEFPFLPGDLLFMYSDGISGKFDPERLNTAALSPRQLAERIVQEYGSHYDDQTIIVARTRDAHAAG
jgi:anti-sigma regulatory factor (Ser/Thr protein kinase)